MVPERSFVGALPVIQCIFSTSSAVARCFGSMVSSACTRFLASCEMLSHQGEGKSYLGRVRG